MSEHGASALGLYLYRVLENDDGGDPLDHRVVRAESPEAAKRLVVTLSHIALCESVR